MESYTSLLLAACIAALISFFASEAGFAKQQLASTTQTAETCVVMLDSQLTNLESRVAAYLDIYNELLEPRLSTDTRADE